MTPWELIITIMILLAVSIVNIFLGLTWVNVLVLPIIGVAGGVVAGRMYRRRVRREHPEL